MFVFSISSQLSASTANQPVRAPAIRLHGDGVIIKARSPTGACRSIYQLQSASSGVVVFGSASMDCDPQRLEPLQKHIIIKVVIDLFKPVSDSILKPD